MILKKSALEVISEYFRIPFNTYEQDWVIEHSNPSRLNEFIEVLKLGSFNVDEKRVIMGLLLSSFDEYLINDPNDKYQKWGEISEFLKNDIYKDITEYWEQGDSTEDDSFLVTSFIKTIQRSSSSTTDE